MNDSTAIWIAVIPATITGIFTLILGFLNRAHLKKVSRDMAILEDNTNNKMDILLASKEDIRLLTKQLAHDEGYAEGKKRRPKNAS